MRVIELMELSAPGWQQTPLAVEWVKEALAQMRYGSSNEISESKIDIVNGTRYYDLPADLLSIKRVLHKMTWASSLNTNLNGSYVRMGKIQNKGDTNEFV